MKSKHFIVLAIILCGWFTGCNSVKNMDDITQISFDSDSGPVLPEMQWHEQIVITKDMVTLTRNGRDANTQINAGSWDMAVDGQAVAALFAELEAVDYSTIKRIEPETPWDGGSPKSYTILYGVDKQFSMVYDPGVTYTNGVLLIKPIQTFIRNLPLPEDAANRFVVSSP